MIASRPPRLADWLLLRLASGPRHGSLIGDLHEQYGRGRSAGWYWRQSFTVIVLGAAADIRSNKLLTARALGFGWVTLWLFAQYGARYVGDVLYRLFRLDEWLFESGLVSHFVAWGLPFSPLGQWLVYLVGGACCGWVVGRLHRDHQAPMVFAFFMSVVLLTTVLIGFVAMRPPLLMKWSVLLFGSAMTPAGILLGGLWGAGRVESNRLSTTQ
jgi:hypothetical protein